LSDVTFPRRNPDAGQHLPKIEEFPDYLFIIINPLTRTYRQQLGKDPHAEGGRPRPFTQLSAMLTPTTLITHHYEQLDCIDAVFAYLGRHRAMVDRGRITSITCCWIIRSTSLSRSSTISTIAWTRWSSSCWNSPIRRCSTA